MSNYNEIVKNTLNNIDSKRKNDINCIPSKFNKFKEFFPGVQKECFTLITASSGIGKSKLARKLFIYDPIEYVKLHPEKNIKLKIFFFSLEESIDRFYLNEICRLLGEKHKINISIKQLKGLSSKRISDDTMALIRTEERNLLAMSEYVEVIDFIKNPTGIFKTVRNYARSNGKFFFKGDQVNIDDLGKVPFDEYKDNYSDHYVIPIVDHISLLNEEKNYDTGMMMNKHETISKLSSDYFIQLRNKYKYSPVIIQQQVSDKEAIEVNYKGNTIYEKLQPSLQGLGDNKLTQRDVDFALGIFSPARYECPSWRGYDISRLNNYYRQIEVLKDRDGYPNVRGHFLFEGDINTYTELPKFDDEFNMQKVYEYINKKENL